MRMCFFGCISLVRVFILRVPEFSLSSYRSSKYFLAVDFIILINFCLCFLLPIAVTDARVGKIEEKLSLILQKKLVSTRELAPLPVLLFLSAQFLITFQEQCPGTIKFQLQLLQVGILFQNLTLIALLSCNSGFRRLKF